MREGKLCKGDGEVDKAGLGTECIEVGQGEAGPFSLHILPIASILQNPVQLSRPIAYTTSSRKHFRSHFELHSNLHVL